EQGGRARPGARLRLLHLPQRQGDQEGLFLEDRREGLTFSPTDRGAAPAASCPTARATAKQPAACSTAACPTAAWGHPWPPGARCALPSADGSRTGLPCRPLTTGWRCRDGRSPGWPGPPGWGSAVCRHAAWPAPTRAIAAGRKSPPPCDRPRIR